MSNTTYPGYFPSKVSCVTIKKCTTLNGTIVQYYPIEGLNEYQHFDLKDCWEEEVCPPPPWCRTSVRKCYTYSAYPCPWIEQCPEPPSDETQVFSFLHNYSDSWRETEPRKAAIQCITRYDIIVAFIEKLSFVGIFGKHVFLCVIKTWDVSFKFQNQIVKPFVTSRMCIALI